MTLNCETREHPNATVKWFYTEDRKQEINLTEDILKLLKRSDMQKSMQGLYKCVVGNSIGVSVKFFNVRLQPAGTEQ